MKNREKIPVIIFSVFRKRETFEYNMDVHATIKNVLLGENISFKELVGLYEGVSEMSLLVHAQHEDYVRNLCKQFDQECYLISNENRDTKLVYLNNTPDMDIGTLMNVSKVEALTSPGYTYDMDTNQYWITK